MNIINAIIRFSLKNKLLVLAGALLIVVGGVWSIEKMDVAFGLIKAINTITQSTESFTKNGSARIFALNAGTDL